MAQEHDLFDDIIEISKGFDFLKNPLGGVTRKCFTVASTKVSGYPTSMINRRMPLAGLTVK